jgi:hypothetical protein
MDLVNEEETRKIQNIIIAKDKRREVHAEEMTETTKER